MSERSAIKPYLKQCAELIEASLKQSIPSDWDVPDKLKEAMFYSLEAGGKRLRPAFILSAAEAVQGKREALEAAIPVACSVEYIHTYSLIHDDLPAMDNDDFRRGKPTNHKVFGEAMAILAGDALLTHAFHLIPQAARRGGIDAETALAIVEDLAKLAGAPGMVGGQVADMLGEQGITSISELEYIHLHKTSDLIVFSVTAGGRIGGASEKQLELLARYGRNIGLAFQIQDDILDLIGDEQKLGKKTNSDVQQNKVTYPFLIGLEESKAQVERLTQEAKSAILEAGFQDPLRLLEIADYLVQRDH
ncbi:polyprenyl synthetase family protein [Paenibacillus sp. N4]|uniref:polyprenyl synthetase family protein n=1 Tax=Paenibacillus vietnamensis TaxID=2590547 RepID=UPI001CD178B7|nr:farnesyl diphosphate synthase [Paenibacillus vietnamensis]MCA0754508.1 polyprenyl synthetase family protein [Paenibacillus vietnamensis]